MSLMVKETEPEVALPTALGSPSAASAELRGQHVVYCFLQEISGIRAGLQSSGVEDLGREKKMRSQGNETKFNGPLHL